MATGFRCGSLVSFISFPFNLHIKKTVQKRLINVPANQPLTLISIAQQIRSSVDPFIYTDLLRKEIYSKSVQNLIMFLNDILKGPKIKEMDKGLAMLFASEKYFCNFLYFVGT